MWETLTQAHKKEISYMVISWFALMCVSAKPAENNTNIAQSDDIVILIYI